MRTAATVDDTVVLSFDDPARFPLIQVATTVRGPVAIEPSVDEGEPSLRLRFSCSPADPADARVALSLPPFAIDGVVEDVALDLLGDGSGCQVLIEAGDAAGWGFAYRMGIVDFLGRRALVVDPGVPWEYLGLRSATGSTTMVPPLQLFRLVFESPPPPASVDLGLLRIRVLGSVRRIPAELA